MHQDSGLTEFSVALQLLLVRCFTWPFELHQSDFTVAGKEVIGEPGRVAQLDLDPNPPAQNGVSPCGPFDFGFAGHNSLAFKHLGQRRCPVGIT